MKKCLAMVISIVMLLSMAVAMPVSAEIEVNLIQNGNFETMGTTATEIPGWTQEGEYSNKNFEQTTALRTAVGADPFANLESTAAVYTVDTNETWAVGRLTQTVTFSEGSDYYVYYPAYSYVLSMDVYVGSSSYKGCLELTVTGADGTEASQTVNYVYDSEKQWQKNAQSFNITELVAETIGAQPIKSIKIGLVGKGNNQCIAYDDVMLTPVLDASKLPADSTPNLIQNGNFLLRGESATEIPGWTQEGEYSNKNFEQTTALRTAVGADPFGNLESTAAVYTVDTNETWAVGRLTQTMTFDEESEYYQKYYAYSYVLSMDVYVGSSSYKGWLELTVTGEDDTVYSQTLQYVYDAEKQWQMNAQSFNITELAAETIGAQPIKSIKIGLVGKGNNQCIAYDNVKLTPIFDENAVAPEEEDDGTVNLIENGSFETVNEGVIASWTQTNPDISYTVDTTGATKGRNRIYYKNLADHAYPGVKQEIVIDKSAEWYTNQEKYRYMLSFDGLVGGLTPTGIVEVTVTDGDGFRKSAVYAGGTDFGTNLTEYWVMKDFALDLSNIIDAAESKVEKIEITLRNNNWVNGEMAWDNVKLAPVYDADKVVPEKELNLIKNGSFEYFDEDGLLIWEQTNPSVVYNHNKNGDIVDRVSGGEVTGTTTFGGATEGLYAIHYTNFADNAYPGVKQTITLGAEDAWYTNQDKHRFMLSFDGLVGGLTPTGIVAVTAYDTDGISNTVLFRGGTDFGKEIPAEQYWTMKNFILDISSALDALETNAIRIDIELRNNSYVNGQMTWDNVKLAPVYDADKVVPVNLIQNSGFEKDTVGTTEFEGWTQTGDADIVFTVSEEAEIGKVAKYEVTPGAVASLTQTVTIDTEADWYKDFRNYRFILSYDSYAPGYAYRGNVKVTVTGENGVTGTAQYDFPYPVDSADQWKMNTFTRDLKDFIETNIGVQPVKSIEVVLVGTHPNGGSILYDNIKLYAEYVQPDTSPNYAANPGFEELDGDILVGWTFSGADQEEVLGMDGAGTEGNHYIALPVGAYADLTLSGEQLPAGAAYLIQFDYKQLGTGGEMKIENPARGNEEMFSVKYGAATGTSEDTAVWKTYKDIIVLSENDTQGARILLRNTDVTNNQYVFYDNVKLTRIDGYDMDNLIKNGSFEAAASNGATSIPGWTQSVAGKPGNLMQMEDDFDLYLPAGMYAVNQTVAIKEYDTINEQNHGYKLEYDVYGNYHKFVITVIFDGQGADDFEIPYEITSIRSSELNQDGLYTGPEGEPYDVPVSLAKNSYVVVDHNVPTHVEYDLTWLVNMFKNPVKSINIEFSSLGSVSNIDNVRLICRKNNISVIDGDGNVVTKLGTAEDLSLKARVRCYTHEENAKVYFAVYDKAADGTLTMKDIVIAPLTGDDDEKNAETDAIITSTVSGKTVVKAVVWGGTNKMLPITKMMIE